MSKVHISKLEYLKAKRIVKAYEKQQLKSKYQFLYWLEGEDDLSDKVREKWITAASFEAAWKQFLKQKSSDVVRVDYEVLKDSEYYSLYGIKEFEDLI